MTVFSIGQRWMSKMEPELGLGTLSDVSNKRIRIDFTASGLTREYALQSAPLMRVQYAKGDTITARDNRKMEVVKVEPVDGLFYYHGDGVILSETELSDTACFSTPKARLMAGLSDPYQQFDLRYLIQKAQAEHQSSNAFGFIGGRVDLIPHQFYIAGEVSKRFSPKVLLSDETGLGKTIEACLILHRLMLSERIKRILILVPESLVHQWFVELYRRFNLVFTIGDKAYLKSFQHLNDVNPFLENQQFIVTFKKLTTDKVVFNQVLNAPWDMVIADEAHHLHPSTKAYEMVAALSERVKGMMLLTATPEQFGSRSHFDHLSLLDPIRYHDYDTYEKESRAYQKTARTIGEMLGDDGSAPSAPMDRKIKTLLEKSGPGRVIFRNTRKVMKTFPKRYGSLYPLRGSSEDIVKANKEWLADQASGEKQIDVDFSCDPRISWLESFLKERKGEKTLLISKSVTKALAIEEALKKSLTIKIAQFNETMSIVQRDRNAAFFSEEEGASLLICSEIGSEGRNFQFAGHLVMFDLPFNPELIEQRIGRLDRIGQVHDIHIHVPYIKGGAQEVFALWVHEGIDLLNHNITGLYKIFEQFQDNILSLTHKTIHKKAINRKKLTQLLDDTRRFTQKMEAMLLKGRDRLLEFNSYRPKKAEALIGHIKAADEDIHRDALILRLFEHFGVDTDAIGPRTHRMNFRFMKTSSFPVPALKREGMAVTFDRAIAMTRQEIDFLTLDHPMVLASIELLLGSEMGNTTLAALKGDGEFGLLIETVYILECIAPKNLHMGRFLPKMPIRVVMDHTHKDLTQAYPQKELEADLEGLSPSWVKEHNELFASLLPEMIGASEKLSRKKAKGLIKAGEERIESVLGDELARLKSLKKVNPAIREEEIQSCADELSALKGYVKKAGLRLDAIRLIRKGTP